MWIIPKNHPLYSAFAQEFVDSKEDLKTHIGHLVGIRPKQSLMWRSKPLSLKIWLRKWNSVYWIRLLFGRTLRPSHGIAFEEKLTSSLEDIHANPFPWQDLVKEQKTPDISGPISPKELTLFDQEPYSLKTSETTLTSDMILSGDNYKRWVIELGKEYTVRKKLVQSTRENDYSSSQSESELTRSTPNATMREGIQTPGSQLVLTKQVQGWKKDGQRWATPNAGDSKAGMSTGRKQKSLGQDVTNSKNWPTPDTQCRSGTTMRRDNNAEMGGMHGVSLHHAVVVYFPTPTARDYRGQHAPGSDAFKKRGLHPWGVNLVEFLQRINELSLDLEAINLSGSTQELLNPAWVAQLMGTTLEKTFFVHLETPYTETPLKSHS